MKFLLSVALLLASCAPAWSRAGGGGGGGGGGCFPAGTMIATISGDIPIEKVRPGDIVLAFSGERILQVEVKEFYEKKDRLLIIRTDYGKLTATSEHPLLTRYGFTEVRDLRKGDEVAVLREGRRLWAKIKTIRTGGVAEVYNLEVALPNTFIADGFVVHNKGGGSYGGSSYDSDSYNNNSRYYSRGRTSGNNLIFVLAGTFLLIKGFFFFSERTRGSQGSAAAPRLLQNGLVTPRAEATLDILKNLGRRDPAFDPDALESMVKSVFIKVQAAWQARDYSALRDIMMPNLHAGHTSKAESMKARGEVNMMEDLKVLHVDFVHVRCPRQADGRSFTAFITASARDYTVKERTAYHHDRPEPASQLEICGGSYEPATFQEFWTFYRFKDNWALARIDQIGELDFINAPNLPDNPQSAAAFPLAAGIAAAIAPSAAASRQPQAPAPAAAPADDLWNKQKMEIAATLAFESVYEAWGNNDSTLLKTEFVSPETLARLTRIMEDRKAEGLLFEFNSLFTRRAEIVLTRPAEKTSQRPDEFTARITATAVRSMLRNGKPLHRDAAPQPFTEYWVFGRQKNEWKLRDILPRMDQESADTTQDGAPTPVQIEWYWKT